MNVDGANSTNVLPYWTQQSIFRYSYTWTLIIRTTSYKSFPPSGSIQSYWQPAPHNPSNSYINDLHFNGRHASDTCLTKQATSPTAPCLAGSKIRSIRPLWNISSTSRNGEWVSEWVGVNATNVIYANFTPVIAICAFRVCVFVCVTPYATVSYLVLWPTVTVTELCFKIWVQYVPGPSNTYVRSVRPLQGKPVCRIWTWQNVHLIIRGGQPPPTRRPPRRSKP